MRAKAEKRRRPIRPRVKLFILSPIYEFFTDISSPKPIFSSTDRNKDQKKRIYAPRRFRILRQALPNAVSGGNPEAKSGTIQPVSDDFRGHFVIRRIPESRIFRFLIKIRIFFIQSGPTICAFPFFYLILIKRFSSETIPVCTIRNTNRPSPPTFGAGSARVPERKRNGTEAGTQRIFPKSFRIRRNPYPQYAPPDPRLRPPPRPRTNPTPNLRSL